MLFDLGDPATRAAADQWAAAQAEVVSRMLTVPMPPGLTKKVATVTDRGKLTAWLYAALHQAGQRGMGARECAHVFHTAAPGALLVGAGVASCAQCLPYYIPHIIAAVTDDRCEVCGALVPPGKGKRFWSAQIPFGGLVVCVDQCDDCRNWLGDTLGGLPS